MAALFIITHILALVLDHDSLPCHKNILAMTSKSPEISKDDVIKFYTTEFILPNTLTKILKHNLKIDRHKSAEFKSYFESLWNFESESYEILDHPRITSNGHFIESNEALLISVHRLSYLTTKFGVPYELGQKPEIHSLSQARSLQDFIFALLISGFYKEKLKSKRISFYAREIRAPQIIDWLKAIGFHPVDHSQNFPTWALHIYRQPLI